LQSASFLCSLRFAHNDHKRRLAQGRTQDTNILIAFATIRINMAKPLQSHIYAKTIKDKPAAEALCCLYLYLQHQLMLAFYKTLISFVASEQRINPCFGIRRLVFAVRVFDITRCEAFALYSQNVVTRNFLFFAVHIFIKAH